MLTTAASSEPIVTRRGLRILPDAVAPLADLDRIEELPTATPARLLDQTLAGIENRDGKATVRFVALQLEYPWR